MLRAYICGLEVSDVLRACWLWIVVLIDIEQPYTRQLMLEVKPLPPATHDNRPDQVKVIRGPFPYS